MKNYRIEIKWVLIFSATYLLWMIIERLLGFHSVRIAQQAIMGTFVLIPSFTIYLLALLDKKKNYYNGLMSFKQGFMAGMVLTLGIVALSPLSQFIIHTIISPDFFRNMTAYAVSSGAMTRQQAGQQLNMSSYIIISVVAGLITGALFSAVAALITKTKTIRSV